MGAERLWKALTEDWVTGDPANTSRYVRAPPTTIRDLKRILDEVP